MKKKKPLIWGKKKKKGEKWEGDLLLGRKEQVTSTLSPHHELGNFEVGNVFLLKAENVSKCV